MSTFISSAVAGKKAAPKAPARRRAAAPVAPAVQTPPSTQTNAEQTAPEVTALSGTTDVARTVIGEQQSTGSEEPRPSHSEQGSREPARQSPARTSETSNIPTPTPALGPVLTPISQSSSSADPVPLATTQPLVWREPVTLEQQRPSLANAVTNATSSSNKRTAENLTAQGSQPAAKRAKKSSARTNSISQAIANNEPTPRAYDRQEPTTTSSVAAQVPKRVIRARTRAQTGDVSEADTDTSTRRRTRQPKSVAVIQNSDDETEMPEQTETVGPKKRRRRPTRKKSKQSGEGEGGEKGEAEEDSESELQEIDPNTLSMYDLSRTTKTGKRSEREKKMAQIDWAEVNRKRRQEADRIASGEAKPDAAKVVESVEGPDGAAGATPAVEVRDESAQPQPEPDVPPPVDGVRFRIVNGQIVEDEDTLRIDRQAQAEASARDTAMVVEENDLTVSLNRTTWINQRKRDPTERVPMWKSRSEPWNDEDTDRFYDALSAFGTDFFSISKMFIGKTRMQIKNKFNREERLDPSRITEALLGKQTRRRMNIEEYAQACGRDVTAFTKYESYEHAALAIKEDMKEKEEQLQKAEEERQENERQENLLRDRKKSEAAARKQGRGRGRKQMQGGGTLGGGQAVEA